METKTLKLEYCKNIGNYLTGNEWPLYVLGENPGSGWLPVISGVKPNLGSGIDSERVGCINSPYGFHVTYHGNPLYYNRGGFGKSYLIDEKGNLKGSGCEIGTTNILICQAFGSSPCRYELAEYIDVRYYQGIAYLTDSCGYTLYGTPENQLLWHWNQIFFVSGPSGVIPRSGLINPGLLGYNTFFNPTPITYNGYWLFRSPLDTAPLQFNGVASNFTPITAAGTPFTPVPKK